MTPEKVNAVFDALGVMQATSHGPIMTQKQIEEALDILGPIVTCLLAVQSPGDAELWLHMVREMLKEKNEFITKVRPQ